MKHSNTQNSIKTHLTHSSKSMANIVSTGLFIPATLFVALISFVATGLHAQPAPSQATTKVVDPIDIKLERKKVTVAEGKEVLVSATTAKPGEVIEETATYTNPSKKNTRRVEATLPVPQYTEPVLGSITPANVKASTDGTTFATIPLKRKVRQPNGVVLEQAVPLSEYRFLRWGAIELAPEKKFIASARFRLIDGVNAAK
jgi:hypothetical protein